MNIFIWGLVFLVVAIDQLSKMLVSNNLSLGQSQQIIKGIFYLTLVHNTGAAFSIFKDQALVFIVISVLAILSIVIYLKKSKRIFIQDIALSLILGGALGNLVDRLRFGYVVDFLDFRVWPVFNVADSAITIGAFLLIVGLLIERN